MAKKTKVAKTGTFVCGVSADDIRRRYFSGEVGKLCADILVAGKVGGDDVTELAKFLEALRDEEREMTDQLKAEVTGILGDETRPPTLLELEPQGSLSEEEEKRLDEWRVTRTKSVAAARQIIQRNARNAMTRVAVDVGAMMDDAMAMTGLMLWLDEDKTEKERVFKRTIIDIIDRFHVSRREAQDRAEVTQSWVEFRNASNLRETAQEYIMAAKKIYGGQQ